jgi:hypothetical protein
VNTRTEKLFSFLVGNMKDMEIELRAQSMVLDALAKRVIDVDHLDQALDMARASTAMRGLVEEKYGLLAQDTERTPDGFEREAQEPGVNLPLVVN